MNLWSSSLKPTPVVDGFSQNAGACLESLKLDVHGKRTISACVTGTHLSIFPGARTRGLQ